MKSSVRGTFGDIAEANTPAKRQPLVKPQRSNKGPTRINLKAVAEVLAERGLDPTEAIVNILMPVDEEGNVQPSTLDPEVQVRVLNELLQYTQPKLKSVEIKAKVAATHFDVNDEQARRIAEEFLKVSTDDL